MALESSSDVKFEIGHVLFIDLVGYSKLLLDEQKRQFSELTEIVLAAPQVVRATDEQLVRLPTGDGMALVFRNSSEEPVQCALEIAQKLKEHPEIQVRMGVHSGPVSEVSDVSGRSNIAGPGINMAQRVMDCGDSGHILLSKRVADDLSPYPRWNRHLHELGECEVKHGVKLAIVNLCTEGLGNPEPPAKFKAAGVAAAVPTPKKSSPGNLIRFGAIVVALILALVGWWFIERSGRAPEQVAGSPTLSTSRAVPKTEPADQRSIAVLAFENLSDDKANEYFSDGISEELLTVLQKIPGLRVAARTSAFSFKGKNANAREIGDKLGVAYLVDGSVRKAGDSVRITARLTQTETGEEKWSENYTRDLKDVFAVQSELARTIVGEVRGQLTGHAADPAAKATIQAQVRAAERGGTKAEKALEKYLLARFHANRSSASNTEAAIVAYKEAVELDPNFALAWAGLAQAHVWWCEFSGEGELARFNEHLARARETAERALALEPNLPEALRARANIELYFDFDWNGAGETLQAALAVAPADPALLTDAGTLAIAKGNTARGIELYREAVSLDPVNPLSRWYLAYSLAMSGHLAEGEAEYRRSAELNPATPGAQAGIGMCFLLQGKFEEAARAAQKDAAEWARLLIVACARWGQERIPEADATLARLIEIGHDTAACQVAEAYAYRGDNDRAFEWLERARQQRDSGLSILPIDPFLARLHEDSRWGVFLRKMGLADDQLK